jgi:hypothetical protein
MSDCSRTFLLLRRLSLLNALLICMSRMAMGRSVETPAPAHLRQLRPSRRLSWEAPLLGLIPPWRLVAP